MQGVGGGQRQGGIGGATSPLQELEVGALFFVIIILTFEGTGAGV